MPYSPYEPKIVNGTNQDIKPTNTNRFYGTDRYGNHATYSQSIYYALAQRIHSCVGDSLTNFIKPNPDVLSIMGTFLVSALKARSIVLGVLTDPIFIIMTCLEPAFELITAMVSLCNGLHYTRKGNHSIASEYYLDATTRLALIIPLSALYIVLQPFFIILGALSFVSRGIATTVEYAHSKKPLNFIEVEAWRGIFRDEFLDVLKEVIEMRASTSALKVSKISQHSLFSAPILTAKGKDLILDLGCLTEDFIKECFLKDPEYNLMGSMEPIKKASDASATAARESIASSRSKVRDEAPLFSGLRRGFLNSTPPAEKDHPKESAHADFGSSLKK